MVMVMTMIIVITIYTLSFGSYILECMMYKALLIFYAQVIRGDRLDRLDAFYLHQLLPPFRVEPILVNIIW